MSSLKDAPQEIQLAVDLIYLLETSEIEADVVLKALEIVKMIILQNKCKQQKLPTPRNLMSLVRFIITIFRCSLPLLALTFTIV